MSVKISNLPPKIGASGIPTGQIPISIDGVTYYINPTQLNQYSLIGNTALITDATGNITNSLVSASELFNLKDSTGNIQTQLNSLSAFTYAVSASTIVSQVDNAIVDGVTGRAPSQNVVYDALVLKANVINPSFSGTLSSTTISATTYLNLPYWSGGSGANSIIQKGGNNQANAQYSIAMGSNSQANGNTSLVFGNNSRIYGASSIILGSNITGASDNTTYVDKLNIKSALSGSSVNMLGIDVDGKVITTKDIYTSGMTFNDTTYDLTINRNDGVSFTQSLSILASTVHITGGTYDPNTGNVILVDNSGTSITISGFSSGMTDSYTTAANLSGNTIKFDNNVQGPNFYSVDLTPALNNKLDKSGGTVSGGITAGTISATTYLGLPTDIRITSGSYNPTNGTISLLNNTGGTVSVSGLFKPTDDIHITGGTFDANTHILSLKDNSGTTIGISGVTTPFTGGTVSGTTTFVNGVISSSMVSSVVSATTYLGLPTDIRVTGGTYVSSASTITFKNNTGGTFSVTGISSSNATQFTGGTVTGATHFTNGLSANTISATTYENLPFWSSGTGSSSVVRKTSGTPNIASGDEAIALGYGANASGEFSYGEGVLTTASGDASHAEGYLTVAGGQAAHAEGYQTIANGAYSHAEGNSTQASGYGSHAGGGSSQAIGDYSFTHGNTNMAYGNSSIAMGESSIASGAVTTYDSVVLYSACTFTFSDPNHSQPAIIFTGVDVSAEWNDYVYTQGATVYLFDSGSANTTTFDFSTTIQIYFDGSDTYIANSSIGGGPIWELVGTVVSQPVTTLVTSTALGSNVQALGGYSFAGGYGSIARGLYSFAFGTTNQANGLASHAEGSNTLANGTYSHAGGYLTQANGQYSHAEGLSSIANGSGAHAEGNTTQANGTASHSQGTSTIARGDNSFASGVNSQSSGTTSFVHGDSSNAGGTNTIVLGANITGTSANTTYVDNFNIKTLSGGTPSASLFVTSTGRVISSATTTNINGNSFDHTANREWRVAQGDTGVLLFSGLSANTSSTIKISAITGYTVDNETNPLQPSYTLVRYSGNSAVTVTTLSSGTESFVLLTSSGTISFQNTIPTSAQRKTSIWLGKVGHPAGSITTVLNEPDYITSPQAFSRDLFQALGPYVNDGVYPYANGSNLKFNITAGNIHGNGINFHIDRRTPNEIAMGPISTGATFLYRTQTGGTATGTTLLDPTRYDNGGVITSVGGGIGRSTIQWIFAVPGAGYIVQYGQTTYLNLADAIAAIGRETFTIYSNLVGNAILIGVIAMRRDCTNLTDTSQGQFFLADKLGQIIGATAGISTGTLQTAYNNSLQPQITTTSTLGALEIKGYNGSSDILQGLNSAGTVTFNVNELGGVTGTTGKFNSISATTYQGLPIDVYVSGGSLNTSTGTASFTNNTGGTFNISGFTVGGSSPVFFDWRYDSVTTSGDPGNGQFRINSSAVSATTRIYIDNLNQSSDDMNFYFSKLTDKWHLFLQQKNDSTKRAEFQITGTPINNSGWWSLPVQYIASNGTIPTNICTLAFQKTGVDTDIYVTGGTFNSSASTITFTNNSGGAFNVTGITVSSSGGGTFTGGTVTGDTVFTSGVTATTFNVQTITAGENLVNGNLVYLSNNGAWYKASNLAEATSSTELRIVLQTIASGSTGSSLLNGEYTTSGLTAGAKYIIGTGGTITLTQPTTDYSIVRYIGTALSSTKLEFNPDESYVELITATSIGSGSSGSGTFTGGTVPGATVFTGGLTADTITSQGIVITPINGIIVGNVVDWNVSHQYQTLSANTTFTFSNTGNAKTIILAITNTASNYTVTWPSLVKWAGGAEPTQSIGDKTDIYTLVQINNNIYGSYVQDLS